MVNLQIGDKYELEVIDICCNTTGYDYLLTMGPDDLTHNVYNIIKCQYASIPNTIYGIVTGFDINGKAKFKQDECRVLQEHYALGHYYTFKIADYKTDNNDKGYYVLEDEFSAQRWYSNAEYEIGDDVILEAKSLANNGYIYYEEHKSIHTVQADPKAKTQTTVQQASGNYPIFNGADESETIEYKTSIVFDPNKQKADIDSQIFNIIKELASFMNAKGGTLYIGIHDKTHEILGIKNDLPHLCEGEDPYAASYTPDYDHYELKIRNSLKYMCGGIASSLISCFEFPKQDGVVYCKITVDAAKRPVWVKGNMLYQRQGNQAVLLRNEEITFFVGERIGSYLISMAGNNSNVSLDVSSMTDLIHSAVKTAINDRRKSVAAPIVTPNIASIKYWIVWYNDGTWVRQRDKSNDSNVFYQLPVTNDVADVVVVFCYGSGTINSVKMKDFKKGANLKKINKNGMNPNETPKEIFITHPSNLIAIHSADVGGTEYIKLHHVSDVNPTVSGKNQGSCIIPRNQGHVLDYKLVTSVQADKAKILIAQKKETSQSFGLPMMGIDIQKEVDYIMSL